MNPTNAIISLFSFVSLGALTLWAIKDLWGVMLALLLIAGLINLAGRKR
ncbi:hypothetical protein NT6N_04400 [Oceaniferula spumae]|uniref:Uncharacterized protein n=1 Tax=Oceaniferula spumae TaxID=2979115 RepID=A0AAT9FHG3_9BACT